MDAGKRTINDIFNGNRVLEIPFFQRAYVWGEQQWERLIDDMEIVSHIQKSYFLGSVILKQRQTQSAINVGDIRTLIDGQQRLTSLCIYFKVLCLKNEEDASFKRMFMLEDGDLALWHNHNDIDAFKRVLYLEELVSLSEKDSITNAYNFFREKLNVTKVDRKTILNNIMFIGIDLAAEEDEQQIFDTINSLGVRLTTAELLKNYFFERTEIENYEIYWRDIFESDEEAKAYWDGEVTIGRSSRTFIDLFFYSYLQIKIQEPSLKISSVEKIEFSKVGSVFESYKSIIKKFGLNKNVILKEIRDYANLFRRNFNYEIVQNELTSNCGIERINAIIFGLDTSTLISYVLYILKNVDEEEQRNELFEIIESYVMRRIIVRATTKNYNQLFTDRLISNKILSKDAFMDYINKSDERVNYLPQDDEVKTGFSSSKLINKQSAGVLYLIESKTRNRNKHATQLLGINKYSLEHLMPKKWVNKWLPPSDKDQVHERNSKLLTLGNLAIITQSLNASVRDSDWEVKRNGNSKNFGLIHYSAGIETLAPYLSREEWNEVEIETRANDLCAKALDIWKV